MVPTSFEMYSSISQVGTIATLLSHIPEIHLASEIGGTVMPILLYNQMYLLLEGSKEFKRFPDQQNICMSVSSAQYSLMRSDMLSSLREKERNALVMQAQNLDSFQERNK